MSHKQAIDDVEKRAFGVRLTMQQLCDKAGVYRQTWSRAKSRGAISLDVLIRMEKALDAIEREKAK